MACSSGPDRADINIWAVHNTAILLGLPTCAHVVSCKGDQAEAQQSCVPWLYLSCTDCFQCCNTPFLSVPVGQQDPRPAAGRLQPAGGPACPWGQHHLPHAGRLRGTPCTSSSQQPGDLHPQPGIRQHPGQQCSADGHDDDGQHDQLRCTSSFNGRH